MADTLDGNTKQSRRHNHALLQSPPPDDLAEGQKTLRRSARRRHRPPQSTSSAPVDPYNVPDTSSDEAEPAPGSPAGAEGRTGTSDNAGTEELPIGADGMSRSIETTTVPTAQSIEHAGQDRSHGQAAAEANQGGTQATQAAAQTNQADSDQVAVETSQAAVYSTEEDMAWLQDPSFEFDTSLLEDLFGDNGPEARQSVTPDEPNAQYNGNDIREKKTGQVRPVPGTAWRRLARDSLMLLDNILSSHARKATSSECSPARARHRYLGRRYVH